MTPRLVVLADDLTGATDAAFFFERRGFRASVWLDRLPADLTDEIVFVALETRRASGTVAARVVGTALAALGPHVAVAKKIDSTLRGNVAAEIVELLSARPGGIAVVVPAHPRAGRIQRDGILLVDGAPVHASEYGRDLHAPVASSSVSSVLPAGLGAIVGAASRLGGAEALRAAVAMAVDEGARAIACDAETPADLEAVVALVASGEFGAPLWVGSAGLFDALAPALGTPAGEPLTPCSAHGPTLFIVGSLTSMTRAQIARFDAAGGHCELVGPREILIDEHRRLGATVGRRAAAALRDGRDALLALSSDRAAVEAALAMGRAHGFDPQSTSRELRERLVELARVAVPAAGRVVVSGGDVARSFCEAYGIAGLRLAGFAASGIPQAVAVGSGLVLVPKGGGAGDPDTYLTIAAG